MEKRAEAARSIMIEAKKRAYIRRKETKMRRNNKVTVPMIFLPMNLFSEESKFLHGKGASSYLDFMPSSVVIRASFADLLLVASSGRPGRDYYICNPLTKQWFNFLRLLEAFKLGKWSQSLFSYPRSKKVRRSDYVDVVTCNGILYWRENKCSFDRIVAFDLFNDQCRVIDFPDDFWSVWQNSYGKVHLGAVCGELRMLQVFSSNEDCFVMKVWELNYSTSWDLVHEIYLKRPHKTKSMVGLVVHPDNSNVIFMIWDNHIFQYKIKEDMYEKVDELQVSINAKADWLLEHLDGKFKKIKLAVNSHERFSTFPLMHLAWPTPVPSHLPSF
ncbi:hypothetical protein L484_009742 [Morus notabilis]|uniref:F-box protein At3g26010-like beta-propeller domain-containing protein n=1 Tax=Morus notabilis TaxID=981085 RepID=W9QME0_9ROSA|nr:hypothetical protein L484_009742 [Morus notabilis]